MNTTNALGRPRVLITEDDADLSQALRLTLQPAYDIVTTASAHDAFIAYGTEGPDLLLVDFQLPDMNGIELLEYVRGNWYEKKTPAVMLSAFTDRREQCMQAGFNAFLEKPFVTEHLVWEIERALQWRRRH